MKPSFTAQVLTLSGNIRMKFKEISRTAEFRRDFKRLLRCYKTLEDDLRNCIESNLYLYHKLNLDNHSIFPISGPGFEEITFYKVKKFACKSLKGTGAKSGIRLIYAYFAEEDRIELIEIYYKGDKENENRERLKDYFKRYIRN
jgi:hypothetical protein